MHSPAHGLTSSDRTFAPHAMLPEELTSSKHWICWKYGQKKSNGKRNKLPCHPVTMQPLAGWQRPEQWLSFDDAVQFYSANPGLAGIGIVLTPELGIVGVDMDHAIDVGTGEVHDWAIEHVRDFDTYTEVSPSGAGFRIFVVGALPLGPNKVGNREIYNSGRWLTITGNVLNDCPIASDRHGAISRYRSKMTEPQRHIEARSAETESGVIPDGERNCTLASVAGAMRRKGLSAEEIIPSLLKVNDERCSPPLSSADVRVIANSVGRYDAAESLFGSVKPEASGRRVLKFRRADELIANPRPLAWLIRGMLERDSLALVFGDPGVGKSFFALDMAACIATGTEWHGHRVTQGPVFYIAGEGGNGIGRRLQAWELSRATALAGSDLFVSTMPASLTDKDDVDVAVTAVADMLEEHGAPALIVIDTVARNFGPGDENSTKDMTAFVAACDRLREQTGACILLVHHSGHGDKQRARGSIALKGALDWEYGIHVASGAVHLTCTKAKDAEPPKPKAFRLTTIDLGVVDEDGEPVTSAVLTPAMYMAPPKQGKAGGGKNQMTAMRVLKEGIKQCEDHFESTGQNPDLAWMSITAWRDKCAGDGLDSKRFNEVKKGFIKEGVVRVDDDRVTLQDKEFAVI